MLPLALTDAVRQCLSAVLWDEAAGEGGRNGYVQGGCILGIVWESGV